MNEAIEFHDSHLTGLEKIGRSVVVRFEPAYLHRSEGEPGVDAGSGWHQAARLHFYDAVVHGDVNAKGAISAAEFSVDSELLSLLPVPFHSISHISAAFTLTNGCVIRIEAKELEAGLEGEALFVEPFPGKEANHN